MKRTALPALVWSEERAAYFWQDGTEGNHPLWYQDAEGWLHWLTMHRSFAFQGKQGHLTLLKEARVRGSEGYWYAYRSHGRYPSKKYVGRSNHVTIERLEAIALDLTSVGTSATEMPQCNAPSSAQGKTLLPDTETDTLSASVELTSRANGEHQQMPLLLSKLQPPPFPSLLVRRERLLTRLDSALQSSLTLLVAPPGSGKTTLVHQWLLERATLAPGQFPSVAWISLEEAENDLARFWNTVLIACHAAQSGQEAGLHLYEMQPVPDRSETTDETLHALLNMLARLPGKMILVLENYQAITSPQIHASVSFFLTHLPATVHLIILTRRESDLPLAHLRASGRFCEITGSELRFSLEEMQCFLQQIMPWSLTKSVLSGLEERLQGWAAGLRLLASAFQGSEQPQGDERLLALLHGGKRPFLDYFVSEIFALQPYPLQEFLLQTCLLGSLHPSLCDELSDGQESAVKLHALIQANLFLEPFDGPILQKLEGQQPWYRYHPLFAEAIQQVALQRLGAHQLRAQAAQAIQWYLHHHLLPEAIESSLAVGENVQAVKHIEHFVQTQQPNRPWRQARRLRHWLTSLPPDLVRENPYLTLSQAESWLSLVILEEQPFSPGQHAQMEECLRLAEEGFRAQGHAYWLRRVFLLRALLERHAGRATQAVSYIKQQEPGEMSQTNLALRLHILGTEALLTGKMEIASQAFWEARMILEQLGSSPLLRSNTVLLGRTSYVSGALRMAHEQYLQVLTSARQEQDRDDIGDAQLGLAQISYEWNQLAEAEQQATEALEIGGQLANEEFAVQAALLLARIEQAQGQNAQAQQRCRVLLSHYPPADVHELTLRSRLRREIQTTLAWLWLKSGHLFEVERWAGQRQQPTAWPPQEEEEDLLVARWLLAQASPEQARSISERVAASAEDGGRIHVALQAYLLVGLAYAATNHLQAAKKQLHLVVERAFSEGYVRLFLDEEESARALLQTLAPILREAAQTTYLRHILRAFPKASRSGRSALAEPLSRQEQRVLQGLCAGQTNGEIARELVVSVNTIKAQVRNIYRKLNVKNRVEASEVARMLNLLQPS